MEKVFDKFLRYVKIETTSVENEQNKQPSSNKEWDLLKLLEKELKKMKIDVVLSEHGYLYAKIPSNTKKKAPKICFISHVDTSPAVNGKDVCPIVWKNYNGKNLKISNDLVLSVKDNPILKSCKGKTLITTNGLTLLGADDKAGISEIMCMAEFFVNHPEVLHGDILIAFTPDEEIGRGTENFDVENFGADFGYTVDGGTLGEIEYENFNASTMVVEAFGKVTHTGDAKGKMKNALRILCEFDKMLPENMRPECTENYEGFYHLEELNGDVEYAKATYLIREHNSALFERKKVFAKKLETILNKKYGKNAVKVEIKDSYYNMSKIIKKNFHLIENAKQAMKSLGIEPITKPIRGGTDGAALSFKNLPCANLCAGGQNFHSRFEFVCLEDMEKIVELLIEIVKIYERQ